MGSSRIINPKPVLAGDGRWLGNLNAPDVFRVQNYGAAGDGVTDDTWAIQRAIDAAYEAGGGTVYLPGGGRSYRIHPRYLTGETEPAWSTTAGAVFIHGTLYFKEAGAPVGGETVWTPNTDLARDEYVVPPGANPTHRYLVDACHGCLMARDNVTLQGDPDTRIVHMSGLAEGYTTMIMGGFYGTTLTNFAVRGITFDQRHAQLYGTYSGAYSRGRGYYCLYFSKFDGITVDGCRFDPWSGVNAIYAGGTGSRNLVVDNCSFRFKRSVKPLEEGDPTTPEEFLAGSLDDSTCFYWQHHDSSAGYAVCKEYRCSNSVFMAELEDRSGGGFEAHNGPGVVTGNTFRGHQVGVNIVTASQYSDEGYATDISVTGNAINDCNFGIMLWSIGNGDATPPNLDKTLRNIVIANNTISVAQVDHDDMYSCAIAFVHNPSTARPSETGVFGTTEPDWPVSPGFTQIVSGTVILSLDAAYDPATLVTTLVPPDGTENVWEASTDEFPVEPPTGSYWVPTPEYIDAHLVDKPTLKDVRFVVLGKLSESALQGLTENVVITGNAISFQEEPAWERFTPVVGTEWEAETESPARGQHVHPTVDNGHTYVVLTAGTFSDTEPTWPTENGSLAMDGGVVWQEDGPVAGGETAWDDETAYAVNDVRVPTVSNGHKYIAIEAGLSGSAEPNWPVGTGSQVADGDGVLMRESTPGEQIWRANTASTLVGRHVVPTDAAVAATPELANHRYRVTAAGTFGATEPVWPTDQNATVTSGTVTMVEDTHAGRYFWARRGTPWEVEQNYAVYLASIYPYGQGYPPQTTSLAAAISVAQYGEVRNVNITGNTIKDCPGRAIRIGQADAWAGRDPNDFPVRGVVVRNNLIVNPGRNCASPAAYRAGVTVEGAVADILVENNVFWCTYDLTGYGVFDLNFMATDRLPSMPAGSYPLTWRLNTTTAAGGGTGTWATSADRDLVKYQRFTDLEAVHARASSSDYDTPPIMGTNYSTTATDSAVVGNANAGYGVFGSSSTGLGGYFISLGTNAPNSSAALRASNNATAPGGVGAYIAGANCLGAYIYGAKNTAAMVVQDGPAYSGALSAPALTVQRLASGNQTGPLVNVVHSATTTPDFLNLVRDTTTKFAINSDGKISTGYIDFTSVRDAQWKIGDQGFDGWTTHPDACRDSGALTSGMISFHRVKIPYACTVSAFVTVLEVVGVSVTDAWFGLYDSAGAQIAITDDIGASLQSGSARLLTTSFSGGGSVSLAANTTVYVAVLAVGTGMPTFPRHVVNLRIINAGLSAGVIYSAGPPVVPYVAPTYRTFYQTGQTALPATVPSGASIGSHSSIYWFGLT